MKIISFYLGIILLSATTALAGTIYHVSPDGNDHNNSGQSREQAFRTLTYAADKVNPGDTVLVAGGTYHEHVNFRRGGQAGKPVVFRALPGETPVLDFSFKPVGWKRSPGTRFTWETSCDLLPAIVWEERYVSRYHQFDSPSLLDSTPGSFAIDSGSKKLFVNPLYGASPETAGIIVTPQTYGSINNAGDSAAIDVTNAYMWGAKGLWLFAPYIHIEGFTVCWQTCGARLEKAAEKCVIKNNSLWGNTTGVATHLAGAGSLIENNQIFLNYAYGVCLNGVYGSISIHDNHIWGNQPSGPYLEAMGVGNGHKYNLAIYGNVENPEVSGNLIAWNSPAHSYSHPEYNNVLFRCKHALNSSIFSANTLVGGSGEFNLIGKGPHKIEHNTVIDGRLFDHLSRKDFTVRNDAIVFNSNTVVSSTDEEKNNFADPDRHDFRTLPGSADNGGRIFFASPEGLDSNDGLLPSRPWRSLNHAAAHLGGGDTLYLLPGDYPETLSLNNIISTTELPLRIFSRANGTVSLSRLKIDKCKNVNASGLRFTSASSGATVASSENITISKSIFSSCHIAVQGYNNKLLQLSNNTFSNCTAVLKSSGKGKQVFRNCLISDCDKVFENTPEPETVAEKVFFAGKNADIGLKELHTNSRITHPGQALPDLSLDTGFHLPQNSSLAYSGLDHLPIGAMSSIPEKLGTIEVEDFKAIALHPEHAIIGWYTPVDYPDAVITLKSGNKQLYHRKITNPEPMRQTRMYVSFPNLHPGKDYNVTLSLKSPRGTYSGNIRFSTPTQLRAPSELFVSNTSGNDGNNGLDPENAFKTIQSALWTSVPGDTITVMPGRYNGMIDIPWGGKDANTLLTLRAEQPGKTVLDGGMVNGVINASSIKYLLVDGFIFTGLKYSGSIAAINLKDSDNVTIQNCRFSPDAKSVTCIALRAIDSANLNIRNNLFVYNFMGIWTSRCSGLITVENNSFYRTGINAIAIGGSPNGNAKINRNIIADVMPPPKNNPAINLSEKMQYVCNDNIYWKSDYNPKMRIFGLSSGNYGSPWDPAMHKNDKIAATIEEARKKFGVEQHGRMLDPGFTAPEQGNFNLKPASPATGYGWNNQ